jgi:WD40 repeat protein
MSVAATPVPKSDEPSEHRLPSGYDAFISYSHAVDGRLAPALQTALQRFAKPWYRLRSLRVFRDEASLSANPALWSAIEDALARSRWFVLLASPTAAASRWVSQEVEYWLANKPVDRLLIVLTEGTVAWNERLPCFDRAATDALPEALLTAFNEEPRWIDVRWARSRDQLTLRDPRFRAAVAELAAPIHGRPKDELVGEEIRQHRRTVRLARAAVAGLATLAVAATVGAILAVRGQTAARAERDRAQEQARLATSRQLAAQADVALRRNEVDLALLLAAQSFRLRDTAEAWDSLVAALNAVPRLEKIVHIAPGTHQAISSDGRFAAVAGRDHRLHVVNVVSGREVAALPVRGSIEGMGLSPEGSVVAVGDHRGAVTIFDLARGEEPRRFPPLPFEPIEGPFQGTSFAIAPRGELVAWNGAEISVWDGRKKRTLAPGVKPGSWLLAFDGRGRTLAAASNSDGTVVVWRLRRGRPVGTPVTFNAGSGSALGGFGEGVASIAFSPRDPRLLVVGGIDGTVAFWDASSGDRLATRQGGGAAALVFSYDGRFLASTGGDTHIWDVRRRVRLQSLPRYAAGGAVAFTGPRRVATAGARTVAVWDLTRDPSQLARRLRGPVARIDRVVYAASAGVFATLDENGGIRRWDTSTLRPVGRPLASGWKTIDLAMSADGKRIAAWRPDATPPLTLWDERGERRDVRGIPTVSDVAFTPAGDAVAATHTREGVELWQTSPAKRIVRLDSSRDADTVHLASGARSAAAPTSRGEQVTLWDAQTGKVLRRIAGAAGVVGFGFSEDGRILATSNWRDSTITLWHATTGATAGRLTDARAPDALAFDHERRRLAALTDPETIRFWDAARREPRGSGGLVASTNSRWDDERQLAFSPDGTKLIVIGLDARPLVFNVDERSWPEIACTLAGRRLTPAEWLRYVGPGFEHDARCGWTYGG